MNEAGFNGRQAIGEGSKLARQLALSTMPYYLIACLISVALYTASAYFFMPPLVDYTVYIVELALSCMVTVVFYRLAVEVGNPARKLIRDTRNLFWASVLVGLLYLILIFIIALFLMLFSGILLAISGFDPSQADNGSSAANPAPQDLFYSEAIDEVLFSPSGVILALLVSVAVGGLAWLAARLVLFGIVTVVSGRIRIFQTWAWTGGAARNIAWSSGFMVVLPFLISVMALYLLDAQLSPTDEGAPWQSVLIFNLIAYILYWPAMLLGHGYAVAVYNQLCPELLDIDEAFG